MSRLCRLKTASHGDDGKWAYNEIVSLRKQRDDLLAALEFSREKIAELHIEVGDGDCHYPLIDDAIASVKDSA